jgi:Spy/CpxP family protein refolding chaperone
MRVAILCAAATALIASAAVAADDPQPKKVADATKIVCRTEQVVGSKIPKRICLTRQQWDQIKQNSQEALEKRSLWQGEKTIPGN